jgi:protein-S-isoprenylcysteine O-methyltransferase Ste14
MSIYSKWARQKHGPATQVVALILAGMLFLILLPYVIIVGGQNVDQRLGLPGFDFGALNDLLGGLMVIVGMYFALWSILLQITRARGTPLPVLPTQELLVQGPFRYCRNPMTFGTILAYLGLGVIAGTLAGIVFVLCFAALLVLYIKLLEEKELAERFGEAYLQYRRETPFMIPRFRK